MKALFFITGAAALLFGLPATTPAQNNPVPPAIVVDAARFDSLQEAVNALPASGGVVLLPPKTYKITEPLRITTENTRFTGSGAATHIINRNEKGEPALVIAPPGPEPKDKKLHRLWRVQLDNFRITGNDNSGDGIYAQHIQEIYLHGLTVTEHGGHGIYLDYCYEDPRIADSLITYNKKSGVYLEGCHDIVVNANHFEENEDGLTCVDSFNLTMNGNNIDDHLRHGVVIENTYASVLSGNMIEECAGTGVVLDRDCYGITLSANVIAHEFEGGIDLRDAHGCAVSANTFTIVHHFGIRVSPDSARITITGNNFSNSHIGDDKIKRADKEDDAHRRDAGSGVRLEDTEHVVISGNLFSGMDDFAIDAMGKCTEIAITSNIVTDIGRRSKEPPPAFTRHGNYEASIIKDNITP